MGLGAALMLVGAALAFADLGTVARGVATALFLLMTAPVAAHQIARAAHRAGIEFWEGTVSNALEPEGQPTDAAPTEAPRG